MDLLYAGAEAADYTVGKGSVPPGPENSTEPNEGESPRVSGKRKEQDKGQGRVGMVGGGCGVLESHRA